MAIKVAVGDGAWLTSHTNGTVLSHTGLGFEPKALIIWAGHYHSSTYEFETVLFQDTRCIGFATSPTDRRCNAVNQWPGQTTALTGAGNRADAIVMYQDTGLLDGLLDVNTFTSDGFTLIVDDASTIPLLRYYWMAIGGSDITAAATGAIAEPGATGVQSYTAGAGFQPTLVVFSGTQLTGAAPSAEAIDTGFMVGAASGTGTGNQFVLATNSDEGSATMDVDQYLRFDECVAMMTVAGGNPNARASFNGFDSVGFDLNWTARASTRQFIYLAIAAGPNVKVGKLPVNIASINNTATVSGLSFVPTGGLICGSHIQESAAGTSTAEAVMSLGAFTSPASRVTSAIRDENGTAESELNQTRAVDQVWTLPSITGTTDATIDLNAMNADGFQLIVDDALSGSVDLGYVIFGNIDNWLPRRGSFGQDARLRGR